VDYRVLQRPSCGIRLAFSRNSNTSCRKREGGKLNVIGSHGEKLLLLALLLSPWQRRVDISIV
jgi:hypothetical protein